MKNEALGRSRLSSCWSGFVFVLTAGAGLTLGACGPGAATPMPEPPTLRLGRIGPPATGVVLNGEGRDLYGSPGAGPAGALVSVTNLDRMDPSYVSSVQPDGSFSLTVPVKNGEELRFDWLRGAERGKPQDALFFADDLPLPPVIHLEPSARFECLTLTPGFALDFARTSTGSVVIQSRCPEPVLLDMPRTRLGIPEVQLQTPLPLTIGVGESATLEIAFTPGPTQREEVLFFNVTEGAQTIRYPITLFGP